MKLLIKASGIFPPRKGEYIAGIGRSNLELIKGLIKRQDPEIELSIYCTTKRSLFFNHYNWPVKYYAFPYPHILSDSKINLESWYRRHIMKNDLFHMTNNFGNINPKENFVVTIHDLFMYNLSEWHRNIFQKVVKYSRSIVTCSEYSKNDIINTFNIPNEKVTVIPWGISHDIFFPQSQEHIANITQKYGIKGAYFFSCSCAHPRKNARYILEAFQSICSKIKDVSLALIWNNPPDEIIAKYNKEIQTKRIIFIKDIDDSDLATLYSGAIATYFVSSFEGFGFPILESMACGTPVVTCANSSLSEIGGDKVFYVQEKNSEDIIDSMLYFYKHGKGETLTMQNHAKKYNWDNTISRYIEFYKRNY